MGCPGRVVSQRCPAFRVKLSSQNVTPQDVPETAMGAREEYTSVYVSQCNGEVPKVDAES